MLGNSTWEPAVCLLHALVHCGLQLFHNWDVALHGHKSLVFRDYWGPQKNFRLCPEDTLALWLLLTSGLSHRLGSYLAISRSPQAKCHLLREEFLILSKRHGFLLFLILTAPPDLASVRPKVTLIHMYLYDDVSAISPWWEGPCFLIPSYLWHPAQGLKGGNW